MTARTFVFPLLVALAAPGCGPEKGLRAFDRTWEVKSGDWHVEGNTLIGRGGVIMTADEQADAVIEMDVDTNGSIGDRTIGIGFRQQPREAGFAGEKKGAGYGFNFTGNRAFNVFRGSDNYWMPVNPAFTSFQPSPALDGIKNHVVIRTVGKRTDVNVNGVRIMRFEDDTFARGRISLWVESTASAVRFSNVKIEKP
ncbi:MAG: hypothetical protein QM820_57560 [Minicystis sp.]